MLRNLFALVLAAAVAVLPGCTRQTQDPLQTSVLQQVRQRGEIRCGYIVYADYIRKDPDTGELSGIFYDLVEQIGRNASLEINWVEEIGYESIFTALDANRFDVFCGGLWPNATRALAGSFTEPAFYSTIPAWVRGNDQRIRTLADIRQNNSRIAVIDGAMEDLIARADYPSNERVSIPQLSPFAMNFENIVSNRADVTFAEPSSAQSYLQSHPGAIRLVENGAPLRTFGNSLVVRKGDFAMREFLDFAVLEVVNSGQMEDILRRYDPERNNLRSVAVPYRETD